MFLKSAKNYFLIPTSITTRLTLFYSLATFALLTVIAIFLYTGMIEILNRANYQLLSNEIDTVQNILDKRPNNLPALEQEVLEIPSAIKYSGYHYYIRILDNKKQLVIETNDMNKIFNPTVFLKKSPIEDKNLSGWQSNNGKKYLLMQAFSHTNNLANGWLIQVVLDISYQQKIIKEYLNNMLSILCIGAIFSIFIGYLIARRGMHSLEKLTHTAQRISVTSLSARISPQSWPKELRLMGTAFNQMLDRIESSFSRLTQFSSDLAHELRTPINNLMGETEVVLTKQHSITEYQSVLESNLEELQRISQLIENLLFLAHVENPKLHLEKQTLNVKAEVFVVSDFYQAIIEEKNIYLSVFGDASIHANPVMFRRAINNIFSNALKYTAFGGKINFYIHENSSGFVEIKIIDNGMGIDSEHLPKIFDRFFRTDSARSQDSGGVGLGLAIVKSIVDLHHGSISIESQPNQGTTLILIFPK